MIVCPKCLAPIVLRVCQTCQAEFLSHRFYRGVFGHYVNRDDCLLRREGARAGNLGDNLTGVRFSKSRT